MPFDIATLIVASLENFLNLYFILLLLRVLLTWFQTASWAQQVMGVVSPVTDPYLNLFRSIIPAVGGMDFSPILAFLALQFLGPAVIGLIATVLFSFAQTV